MQETSVRVGPQNAGDPISAEDYASAEWVPPFRYERAKGKLVVMPPAGPDHRESSRPFQRELNHYWAEHRDVIDYVDVEGWVSTSDKDDRLPDLCVYLNSSANGQKIPARVPDMIFEIVSGGKADRDRDYIDKREEYHRIRVKEYVIVDRFKRQVLVLTWQEGDYKERLLKPEDTYTSPLLPGLEIPLAEAFA